MQRFKFKLKTVLDERKKVEDLRLREWTLAKRFLQVLLDDLIALEKSLADTIVHATEVAASPLVTNIATLSSVDDFIAGQKTRIVWKSQEIERGTKLTEKKRREYLLARQKREVLEKLKERKLAEHKDEVKKSELRKLDEIYIMNGAARRRMDEADAETDTDPESIREREATQ